MDKFYFCTDTRHCNGGEEHCPGPRDNVTFFTQIVLNSQCSIPEPKPNSEKLVDFFHTVEILKAEALESEEYIHGHKVKGKKAIVAGTLQLGIEYSEQSPEQMVHYFHCDLPFNAIIMGCKDEQEHLLPYDFCLDDYLVHVCVEHIQVRRISERVFDKVIVLMIWLQHRVNQGCWDRGGESELP